MTAYIEEVARLARAKLRHVRMPTLPIHRALAWEYRLRTAGLLELQRVIYYQPIFEALCDSVGEGVHLECVPTSKLPAIINVRLHLGNRVRISGQTTFTGARLAPERPKIEIGDHSYIGYGANICAGTSIKIGKHVLIAGECFVSGDPGHPLDHLDRMTKPAAPEQLSAIEIGDHAWLARGASVIGKVRIGEGAIVGSRAVVTRDVPPFGVVVGNPARLVRVLNKTTKPETVNKLRERLSDLPPSGRNEVREGVSLL